METNGDKWSKQVPKAAKRSKRGHREPYIAIGSYREPYGAIWSQKESYTALVSYWKP